MASKSTPQRVSTTSLDLIYEISTHKVHRLQDIVEAQERKAATFITTISITTAAIFSLTLREYGSEGWGTGFACLLSITVGVAGYGLVLCIKALHIKEYPDPPAIRGLRENYLSETPERTKDQILANLDAAYGSTKLIIDEKARHLIVSSRLLKVLVVLLILGGVMRAVVVFTAPGLNQRRESTMSSENEPAKHDAPILPKEDATSKKPLTQPDSKLDVFLRESKDSVKHP